MQMRDEHIPGCRESIGGKDWIQRIQEGFKRNQVIETIFGYMSVFEVFVLHKVRLLLLWVQPGYTPVGEGHNCFTWSTIILNLG